MINLITFIFIEYNYFIFNSNEIKNKIIFKKYILNTILIDLLITYFY